MFARFRNLFSKNKMESETETAFENSDGNVVTPAHATEDSSKLEGITFLKDIVKKEQQQNAVKCVAVPASSLSEEVAELISKRISKNKEMAEKVSKEPNNSENYYKPTHNYDKEVSTNTTYKQKDSAIPANGDNSNKSSEVSSSNPSSNNEETKSNNFVQKDHSKEFRPQEEFSNSKGEAKEYSTLSANNNEINSHIKNSPPPVDTKATISETAVPENMNLKNSAIKLIFEKHMPPLTPHLQELDPSAKSIVTELSNSSENSPKLSDSSKSLAQSSIKDNHAHSTSKCSSKDFATKFCNNSSIVVEDLPSEISTPSPTVESTISGSSSTSTSNTSTLESSAISEIVDPSKIIVQPIDNNALACKAITNKLSDIAEVAESLDAVIRDVQETVQAVEIESNHSSSHKKLGTLRSTSSEDWHSRSTEDDSFATASEGNFTPSSSSFQTASGRTSSYISCEKNSFDASEAEDSTYAYEMPELTSPLNMSFEGSEQSYLSTQQLHGDVIAQDKQQTPTNSAGSVGKPTDNRDEDQGSVADIDELHSESATPTPEENYNEGYQVQSTPIESETESEIAAIVQTPSLSILTEYTTKTMSRTPEVSPSTAYACSNQNPIITQLPDDNVALDSNEPQEQYNTTTTTTNNNNNNNNNIKPNAAWRRSKYYENITKQTIKGFL